MTRIANKETLMQVPGKDHRNRWNTLEGQEKCKLVIKAILAEKIFKNILKGFPGANEVVNGKDLRGIDFSNLDLSERNFTRCNLRYAIFEGSNLNHVCFKEADLRDVDFRNANLRDADFKRALCKRVMFIKATLEGAKFKDTLLEDADFRNADLTSSVFKPKLVTAVKLAYLKNLRDAKFIGADFTYADLKEQNFSYANLEGANLQGTNLKGCNFEKALLANVGFDAKTRISKAILLNQDNFSAGKWRRKKISESKLDLAKEGYRILKAYFRDQSKDEDYSWAAFNEKRIERKLFWQNRKFIRWGISSALNLLCGYGEKPYRVILTTLGWIFLFSVLYFFAGLEFEAVDNEISEHNISYFINQCLSYSIATFTNFQIAEPQMLRGLNRYIALIEAFFGFFTLGLFIFTLTRRYATRS